MKPDELRFLYAVNLALKLGFTPRDVINDEQIGIPHKRCWWFLEKWSRRQRYEYGVTLDLGWWTPAGKAWAEETIAKGIERMGQVAMSAADGGREALREVFLTLGRPDLVEALDKP